jgi:hypothetical protein
MTMERFTDRARKIIALSNSEAQRFNHEYLGTEHLLLGIVKEGSGVAANVLKNLKIDLRLVRLEVEKLVKSGPDMVTMGKLPHTPRVKRVFEYAVEQAKKLNHNYIGSEHLLLGLLCERDGIAVQVLLNLGVTLDVVRVEILNLLGAGVPADEPPIFSPSVPPLTNCFEDSFANLDTQLRVLLAHLMVSAPQDTIREGMDILDALTAIKARCVELGQRVSDAT